MGASDEKTLPSGDDGATPNDLSVGGRVLMAKLESRLFEQDAEPVKVGRFVVVDQIGRGGMGIVYRAYDPKLDRRVAVKILKSLSPDAGARLLREAKLLARLSHPNVVTIHEVGEEGDDVFVAMEYIDGGTLAAWCAEHPGPSRHRTRAIVDFAYQAIDGLVAAHALGLVHRDIKPANMLVGADGRLRLADFGLARPAAAGPDGSAGTGHNAPGSMTLTATGAAVGTPAYMAPEQFAGSADARSDQFCFCASFFEALYGARPYDSDSIAGLLERLESGKLESVSREGVPDYVYAVLERGLRPRPEDRFPDMVALRRALRRGEKRRTVFAVGAVAVVLVGGATAAVVATSPRACRDERELIEAATSPDRRARIEAALLASGMPFVEGTWSRADGDLDELVEHWSTSRLEACRLSRHSDPERAADGRRQLACLDRSLATTDSVLGDIDTITEAQARAFPNFLQVIVDSADCDDPDQAVYDSELGLELADRYRDGQLAEKRFEHEAAIAAFEEVLRRAADGRFPRLRVEAHVRLSELVDERGDIAGFREHTVAALDAAQEAGDSDLIAVGYVNVAELLPDDAPWETVELFLGRARRLVEAGKVAPRYVAEVDFQAAKLRLTRSQPEQAGRLLRKAIETGEQVGSSNLPHMYYFLSIVHMMEGDMAASVASAEKSVQLLEDRLGPKHPDTATAMLRLAEAQGFHGKEQDAEETLDRAIDVLARSPEYRTRNVAVAYSSRGDARRNLGRHQEATEDYQRAIEFHRRDGDSGTSEGLVRCSIARAHYYQGTHAEGLVEIDKALALIDPTTMAYKGSRADAMILRAQFFAQLGRTDESAAQLEAAREPVSAAFPRGSIVHVQAMGGMAAVLTELARYDEAQQMVGTYLDSDHDLDGNSLGRLQTQRARTHHAAGDDAAALAWAGKAMDSLGPDHVDLKDVQKFISEVEGGVSRSGDPDAVADSR